MIKKTADDVIGTLTYYNGICLSAESDLVLLITSTLLQKHKLTRCADNTQTNK